MSTFEGYAPFATFAAILTVIGIGMLAVSRLLGPRRPGRTKSEPWECGVDPLQRSARERFAVPFYLVAILFILFDLETVFLFPWAVVMKKVAATAPGASMVLLAEVFTFTAILGMGLFYVWKRRGLEWD